MSLQSNAKNRLDRFNDLLYSPEQVASFLRAFGAPVKQAKTLIDHSADVHGGLEHDLYTMRVLKQLYCMGLERGIDWSQTEREFADVDESQARPRDTPEGP